MEYRIGNKIITSSIESIIKMLQNQLTNGKLSHYKTTGTDDIIFPCPVHSDGLERHPSCTIYTNHNNSKIQYGKCHCFACGYTSNLGTFVADCFDEEPVDITKKKWGDNWLLENCDTAFFTEVQQLPEISTTTKKVKKQTLPESILSHFAYYHQYMWERKLSKEIVDLFEVGYDPADDTVVFPVRDEKGDLVFFTKRKVKTKKFEIPKEVKKPVYLLYYALSQRISSVAVCEGQIDALYMWSIGVPCVALFGTGTSVQLETLKKSGIRIFNLYLDGDSAGRKGAARFKKYMPKDILVNTYLLPEGKDVNDLTKEQVYNLKCI